MSNARTALEAVGQLPDTEIDIADAALHLARIDRPEADWPAARAHLSDLARDAVALTATAGCTEGSPASCQGATGGFETFFVANAAPSRRFPSRPPLR